MDNQQNTPNTDSTQTKQFQSFLPRPDDSVKTFSIIAIMLSIIYVIIESFVPIETSVALNINLHIQFLLNIAAQVLVIIALSRQFATRERNPNLPNSAWPIAALIVTSITAYFILPLYVVVPPITVLVGYLIARSGIRKGKTVADLFGTAAIWSLVFGVMITIGWIIPEVMQESSSVGQRVALSVTITLIYAPIYWIVRFVALVPALLSVFCYFRVRRLQLSSPLTARSLIWTIIGILLILSPYIYGWLAKAM